MLIRYSTDQNGHLIKKARIYTQDEHNINTKEVSNGAMKIIKTLKDSGYEAYIVGGAVRDLLNKRRPKDFDIVTDALPPQIKKMFKNSHIIGKRFRLVHVYIGKEIYEVCTFRSIEFGTIGNVYGPIDQDVLRRDFTLNALYYDPIKNQIIDYVGGVDDINKKVIRPVIPLDRIFEEDPVRMIRAVKYSATTGCRLPRSLKRKIAMSAPLLLPVSQSRLTEEIIKIINSGRSYDIINIAIKTSLFNYLQPNVTTLMNQNKSFEIAYIESLKLLDDFVLKNPESHLWERMTYILRDFIASVTDWNEESKTQKKDYLFEKAIKASKNFISPMCPPNIELEKTIRKLLSENGLEIPFRSKKEKRRSNNSSKDQVKLNDVKEQKNSTPNTEKSTLKETQQSHS